MNFVIKRKQRRAISSLRAGSFDFLDFGCSNGGSIAFAQKYLGGVRGLGIDIDPKKIESALTNGFEAIQYDILKLDLHNKVNFLILSHFLEHLPHSDVSFFVEKACQVSTDFVYIQQPFFDCSYDLFKMGYKLTYSDWHGHRNSWTVLDFFKMGRGLKNEGVISDFIIRGFRPITSTSNPHIIPLNAPKDSHIFDPSMGAKTESEVHNIFEEISVVLLLSSEGKEPKELGRYDEIIFDSSSETPVLTQG